jgi:hypothetical protein
MPEENGKSYFPTCRESFYLLKRVLLGVTSAILAHKPGSFFIPLACFEGTKWWFGV